MNVLVTGAAGFIGRHLIERLLRDRLQDHLVADLGDAHLGALEAEFLGQDHRLAVAIHDQFSG